MRCPHCNKRLSDAMLPARCPYCHHNLANVKDSPRGSEGAKRAKESRESARGLAGGENYKPPKTKRFGAVITLFVISALIGLGVFISWKLELWGGSSAPDVVGWNVERAEADLTKLGYKVATTGEKSDEAPDIVIKMDPSSGRLEPGSTINLVVSEGRFMPEAVGKNRDEVTALMDEEGLKYEFEEEIDDGPENVILSSTIGAGKRVTSDQEIKLTVAVPRLVPDVMNKDEAEAREMLMDLGYQVEVKTVAKKNDQKENSVVGCEPTPGTKLAHGSKVTISVVRDRVAKLKEKAEKILNIVYNWDPLANPDNIGALREHIDPSMKINNKKASDASAQDIWYSLVKAGKRAPSGIDSKLERLPRTCSINSVDVAKDGTVTCSITVKWDWSPLGAEYKGTTSTDTRSIILKFNDKNQLTSFSDPNADMPLFDVVDGTESAQNDKKKN